MDSLPDSSLATISPGLATAMPQLGRGAKAAREFEASLIASLLESMEKTFASLPGDGTLPGADNYNYLGIQALITRHLNETRNETGDQTTDQAPPPQAHEGNG